MKVTEIREGSALADLQEQWTDLLQRMPAATVYQTWEWNHAWWSAYGRRKSLRLLLVHDGDELVAIAPLYLSRHLGTPLRRLAYIGTGASDYLDVIADEQRAPHACRALLSFLESARSHDLADLQQIPEWSPLAHAVKHLRASSCVARPLEICPYVALPETWDVFIRGRGKRLRSNIAYYERLLQRSFEQVETVLVDKDGLDAGMTALFDLHGRRWRSRMMPGVLSGSATRRFHRDVAARFSDRGWLRLHATRVDGKIVAGLYCFSYRRRYYYYLGGFEPALGRYSIGTTLTASAIRQAIAEGCSEFDFLRGHEAYKYRWAPEERTNAQLLVPSTRRWRSSAMLRLNRLERRIESLAKAWSDRGKGSERQRETSQATPSEGVQIT